MSALNQLRIPRCVKLYIHQPVVEVHGFCVASQRAFGACIYLRIKFGLNDHHSELLCSKSRVALFKTVTAIRVIPLRVQGCKGSAPFIEFMRSAVNQSYRQGTTCRSLGMVKTGWTWRGRFVEARDPLINIGQCSWCKKFYFYLRVF